MPSQKNNDLLIKGGLIALLIFLLRKAGSSAPLPGDTFGAPFAFGGGNFKGMPVKWVYDKKGYPLQVTQKPNARENDIFTVKDANTQNNYIPKSGQVIGTVINAVQDTGDKRMIWFEVRPNFTLRYKTKLSNFWIVTFNDGQSQEFFKVG